MSHSAAVKGARTGVQGGAAVVILEAVEAFGLYDLDERQYAVALVILAAVISWAQNALEGRNRRRGQHEA